MFDFPPFPFVPLGGSPLRILIIFASVLETSRDVLEIRRNLDRGLLLGVVWAGGLVAQNIAGIAGIPGGSPPLPPFSEIVDPQLVDLPVSVTEAEPWILSSSRSLMRLSLNSFLYFAKSNSLPHTR